MYKKKQNILLFFLFCFAIYCALTIGRGWDEGAHLIQGKITLNYLFSLGKINKDFLFREIYSPIYWSFQYLLTTILPIKYQIEVAHLINLIFSIFTIFGISKISKILFNKEVGKISFLILFFYPIFFGHMSINSKDSIIAFSNVWIVYYILEYLKKQSLNYNTNKLVFRIGVLTAISTGILLFFAGSLIPIFLFLILEIFLFKKIINKSFSIKKFFIDLFKCFVVFYFLLTFFWIDAHPNVLTLPYQYFMEFFNSNFWTGWPYNLVGGNYFLSAEIPKNYLLTSIFYKTPEYILIAYILFIFLYFFSKDFFLKKFKYFNYKISLIVFVLIFPNIILFLIPFPIYDGMRLFLWILPYFCIIPALSIYHFVQNYKSLKSKINLTFLSFFIIYYLFNFFLMTPYHYTYLNLFSGKNENRYKKFENDYWGSSLKELIKKTDFEKNKVILIATCGVSLEISKKYFKNSNFNNLKFVDQKNAEYVIMTNRAVFDNTNQIITNCYDKFNGVDVFKVERNNLMLSTVRKIKNF